MRPLVIPLVIGLLFSSPGVSEAFVFQRLAAWRLNRIENRQARLECRQSRVQARCASRSRSYSRTATVQSYAPPQSYGSQGASATAATVRSYGSTGGSYSATVRSGFHRAAPPAITLPPPPVEYRNAPTPRQCIGPDCARAPTPKTVKPKYAMAPTPKRQAGKYVMAPVPVRSYPSTQLASR